MRLFVCSYLSDEAQALYARALEPLFSAHPGMLRPVPKSSVHLTHAFVGRYDGAAVDELVRALRPVADHLPPVETTLGLPFVLHGGSEARLVCAPVTRGSEAVQAISTCAVAALAGLSSVSDLSGSRSPHATLARFRRNTRRSEARPIADRLSAGLVPARDEIVAALQIVSSTLTPSGAVYTVLADLPLG